jgi:hypothetical protein
MPIDDPQARADYAVRLGHLAEQLRQEANRAARSYGLYGLADVLNAAADSAASWAEGITDEAG